jgi:hypothetical protein
MAKDESGQRWPAWPVAGAVGAGRRDEASPVPDSFGLTPSALAEQAAQVREILDVPAELLGEVPGAEPEPPG